MYDFQNFVVDQNGLAAFSNGQTFFDGRMAIASPVFANDINLETNSGPTGLFGTFLVIQGGGSNKWVLPGGNGSSGSSRANDDLTVTLSQPATAFGVLILDNLIDSQEWIIINGANGEIERASMPGSNSGSGGNGFVGFVVDPADDLITSVTIQEGNVGGDDIAFDCLFLATCSEPANWVNYGTGCSGTNGVPSLTLSANPVIGSTINLLAGNSRGITTPAIAFVGLAPGSQPAAGCTLLVTPPFVTTLAFLLPPSGATIPVTIPEDADVCGLTAYVQLMQLDPGALQGLAFTPGLEMHIGV
jgi:hypothetical protein